MKILIDECLPAGLKGSLAALGYECETVRRAGYGSKKNGELLQLAEGQWDVLLTSDRNIKYQQNLTGRNVSIVILLAKSNRMKDLLPLMPACAQALLSLPPGRVVRIVRSMSFVVRATLTRSSISLALPRPTPSIQRRSQTT